jgi:hypothetical protein
MNLVKTLLREAIFSNTEENFNQIKLFIQFAKEYLGIKEGQVSLELNRDRLTTTAAYANKEVLVYVKERAVIDIMRSIAHELVHLKQDIEGRLKSADHEQNNAAGSPIEDEANAKAGEIIRQFGSKHQNIYN